MPTVVEICSNALLLLGDGPITSLAENTARATVARSLWPSVRDMVLRARTWNCAKKRVTLSPVAGVTPGFGFSYAFQKPTDWLRTLQVGEDNSGIPYADDSGQLLANVASLPLLYTWRNDNPDTYDVLLIDVLILAMASRMAFPITKSATTVQTFAALYEQQIKRAASVDAQDEPPQDLGGVNLLGARR